MIQRSTQLFRSSMINAKTMTRCFSSMSLNNNNSSLTSTTTFNNTISLNNNNNIQPIYNLMNKLSMDQIQSLESSINQSNFVINNNSINDTTPIEKETSSVVAELSSVILKRRKKMSKHKQRKLRKRMRALKKKLGKI